MKKTKLFLFILLITMSVGLFAQSLLYDDFTGLTVGNNLAGQSSWIKGGTGPDPTIGNATALSYSGYKGGGGEYVIMPTAASTASRVYKALSATPAPGTNTFFYSALINLSSATATGDYFMSLGDPGTGSVYFARLFAKSTTGGYLIGGSKLANVATANFGSTVFSFNTTYVVVVRYTFFAGSGNDLMYVWVNPSLATEPSTSGALVTVTSTLGDGTPSTVGNFHWHNRTASNPVGTFDGVRVAYGATSATAWANLDAYQASATPTIILSTNALTGFTYEYLTGPSTPANTFTVSGVNLTNGVSVAAPANYYEISKSSDSGYTTPLTYTIAEVATPQTIYVRLKGGLAIGTYNGEVINITSSGATPQTVTCSGEVTTPPPPEVPEVTEPTVVETDSFIATWDAVSGATGYYLDVYTLDGSFASDLIISEYVEGGGSNKYIEIYNGTGSTVNLSNYYLQLYSNGATTATGANNVQLSGILAHGSCAVYRHADAVLTLPVGVTASVNSAVNFNGDDAVALYYNDGAKAAYFVDIFGWIGTPDPGTQWGTSPLWTINTTLVRKSSVTGGVTVNPIGGDFPTLTTEWDNYAQDTASYLGSHTMAGSTLTYVSGYQNLDVDNVTSYEVTGLAPNTAYFYVVRAYNDYGTSSSSLPQGITTQDEIVPVELSSFTAVITAQNYVMINWTTQTETNVSGYYIYRNTVNNLEYAFQIPALIGATNTSQETSYSFIDQDVEAGNTYYYWLQNMDMGGSSDFHGPISVTLTEGEGPITPIIPTVTELLDAYPNPFGQSSGTRIHYTLKNAENVKLEVYNIKGQVVWTADFVNDKAGDYRVRWDGKDMSGKSVSTGVYYYRMTAGKYVSSKKVILMK